MKNIINLSDKRKEDKLPTNVTKVDSTKTVRIPILDRVYEIDGELYFETKNDSTPRKLKDYSQKNFNRKER